MKYKQGKLFKRITKSQDYHRIGKENWEKLKKDESVDFEPLKELVDKGYLIEEKKENKKGDK
jgi:hypothetical protein|tara:strand:- start:537 stop:722 length:186 start_codon:yes stop_codon:yes gene_type:complete